MGKAKKIRRIDDSKECLSEKQEQILAAYEMFDDRDISTERLLAMAADYIGCEIDDVVEALYLQSIQNGDKKN